MRLMPGMLICPSRGMLLHATCLIDRIVDKPVRKRHILKGMLYIMYNIYNILYGGNQSGQQQDMKHVLHIADDSGLASPSQHHHAVMWQARTAESLCFRPDDACPYGLMYNLRMVIAARKCSFDPEAVLWSAVPRHPVRGFRRADKWLGQDGYHNKSSDMDHQNVAFHLVALQVSRERLPEARYFFAGGPCPSFPVIVMGQVRKLGMY